MTPEEAEVWMREQLRDPHAEPVVTWRIWRPDENRDDPTIPPPEGEGWRRCTYDHLTRSYSVPSQLSPGTTYGLRWREREGRLSMFVREEAPADTEAEGDMWFADDPPPSRAMTNEELERIVAWCRREGIAVRGTGWITDDIYAAYAQRARTEEQGNG